MSWRRRGDWPDRPPRPKVQKLTAIEKEKLSKAINKAIVASPVLSYFKVEAKLLRGRFYIEWQWSPNDLESAPAAWGRITPIAGEDGTLLLEVEFRKGKWSEIARGSAQKAVKAIAGDTKGTFHALGTLDKVLRRERQGLTRLTVKRARGKNFKYSQTGEPCGVQEALFHYFGLPLEIIIQPHIWYSRHRKPLVVDFSKDRQRVLVRFGAMSSSGGSFGGTCLYVCDEGRWGAYTIRPSESENIESAEAWLVKRKWRAWC